MDRYAVIGNPVSHSKSPLIHKAFSEQTGELLNYEKIEGGLDSFESDVRDFFAKPNNKGLNVTVPFKERAYAMCDELTPRAKAAEAVNTLYLNNGGLVGDNTDGRGLVVDLEQNYGIALRDKRILLIGAGGASKGVMLPLLEANPERLVVTNRTLSKAEQLVGRYKGNPDFPEYGEKVFSESFDALDEAFDVVINGTSASLSGALPKISPAIFSDSTYVYDMMYGDQETVFNRWAIRCGATQTMDGLGMLIEQAAEAFRVWRNIMPDTQVYISSLR